MKALFQWDTFFACLLIFATTTGLYYIPTNFDFLNPLKQALGDFDITDAAQSRFRDETQSTVDTSIVLVNLSTVDRASIAHMLRRIAAEKPAVIGIDAMFRRPKNADTDSTLAAAMHECPNLVLGCKLLYNDSTQSFDDTERQLELFAKKATSQGFYNVITDDEKSFRTVREFSPFELVKNDTVLNFAVAVAKLYKPECVEQLITRDNSTEFIHYRGATQSFYALDVDQVLDDSADISLMRNKIVLMGYIDTRIDTVPRTLEDAFFTPLNPNYAGRTFPDMYGVVIHANVVSQLLHATYINEMPLALGILIGFILCVSTVACFNVFEERYPDWYDAFTIATFLVQSISITFLHIVVYNRFHYKLNMTISLAALALTPTVHELYHNSVKPLFWKAVNKLKRKTA